MRFQRCKKDRWLSIPQRIIDVFVVFMTLRCLAALPFVFMVFGAPAISIVLPCLVAIVSGIYALMFGHDRFFRVLVVASTSYWVSVAAMLLMSGLTARNIFGALTILGFVIGEAFAVCLRPDDEEEK